MEYFHLNDLFLCPGMIESNAAEAVAENRTNSHDGYPLIGSLMSNAFPQLQDVNAASSIFIACWQIEDAWLAAVSDNLEKFNPAFQEKSNPVFKSYSRKKKKIKGIFKTASKKKYDQHA